MRRARGATVFVLVWCAAALGAACIGEDAPSAAPDGADASSDAPGAGADAPTTEDGGAEGGDGGDGAASFDCGPGCVVLASAQTNPTAIAVDGLNVYWTNDDVAGSVMSCSTTTCTPTPIATGENRPVTIALDATRVYWGNKGSGEIRTYLKNGSSGAAYVARSLATLVSDVAVNGGYLTWVADGAPFYWCQYAGVECNGAGGPAINTLASSAHGVAITPFNAAGFVWAYTENGGTFASCFGMPGNCGGASGSKSNVTDLRDIVTDGAVFYYTRATAQTGVVVADNGTATPLAPGLDKPWALAQDASNLYFTVAGDGTVRRVAKSGGMVKTLAYGLSNPIGIAVDATSVYVTSSGDGHVVKAPK